MTTETTAPYTPSDHPPATRWLFDLLLVLVLVAAAGFRMAGLNWGENQYLHPDERFLVWVGSDISPVHSLGEYFDAANSSLNPVNRGHGFYVYGDFPMFLTRYLVQGIFGHSGFDEMTAVGRPLSVLFDVLAVLFIYLIAERIYDRRVGLLAAAFSAAAVLQIQQAHYFTMDTFAEFFALLALYFAIRVQNAPPDEEHERDSFLRHPYFLLSLGFGLALALALASKLNLMFILLAATLPAAFAIRLWRLAPQKREAQMFKMAGYVALAAVVAVVAFRILQPYVFSGPGFFGLKPNQQFLDNLREQRAQTDTSADFPPAMQWARRGPTFSLQNMLLWGLGLPLGLLAWSGFLWAGWRMLKGDWQQHLLAWAFTGAHFAYWSLVTNPMLRYQLPIYPLLCLFAGWLLVALYDLGKPGRSGLWNGRFRPSRQPVLPAPEAAQTVAVFAAGASEEPPTGVATSTGLLETIEPAAIEVQPALAFKPGRRLPRLAAILTGATVLILTYAYAAGFTGIYLRPITRVAASRWIYQNIPGPLNLHIQTDHGLFLQPVSMAYGDHLAPGMDFNTQINILADGTLTELYFPHIQSLSGDDQPITLAVALSNRPSVDPVLAEATISNAFPTSSEGRGQAYTLKLDRPLAVLKGDAIYLRLETRGSQPTAGLLYGPLTLDMQTGAGQPVTQTLPLTATLLQVGSPYGAAFNAESEDTLMGVTFSAISAVPQSALPKELTVEISMPNGEAPLATARLATGDTLQPPMYFSFDNPVPLIRGEFYTLRVSVQSAPGALSLAGDTIANEGDWDDGLPLRLNNYDAYAGLYPPDVNFNMYPDDTPEKLQHFKDILNRSDYVLITSSRQWGSLPRIPERFPFVTLYYRNLLGCPPERDLLWCYRVAEPGMFQGTLGFDLVEVFESPPSLGPVKINDQFAEESFTVYDHPKVFVFRKSRAYNAQQTAAVLDQADFTHIIRMPPGEYPSHPVDLMLPENREAQQVEGGTWSALFDPQALANRFQPLGVIFWYLSVLLLGLITYPLLRLGFHGLPDKAYPLARTAGMLLLSYLVWLMGSAGIPATRLAIAVALGLMVVASAAAAFHQRDELSQELHRRRKYFLLIEAIALGLFVLDMLIRLGNPDLWHPNFGGEKPMDFSYFNAVLKSTTFPPYDPWYAGGYLNYYYYGFVFVGVLVKLLGIVPSFAYNLILPTVFSLFGLGAFSAAWNLAGAWKVTRLSQARINGPIEILAAPEDEASGPSLPPEAEEIVSAPDQPPDHELPRLQLWAGVAGMLSMAVLGNLGTLRMIWKGYQRLAAPGGVIDNANFIKSIAWAAQGFMLTLQGKHLPYGLGDWYWIPSRAIPAPNDVEPITEFPFFTTLYADPHAHLFAMPIALLALSFALAVLLGRGRWKNLPGVAAAFGFGALAIGALRPTNTWDFPTYLALGVVAVAYTFWFHDPARPAEGSKSPFTGWPPLVRRLLVTAGGVLALIGLAVLFFKPYADWYALGYTQVKLWDGTHTPLGSYLVHWGLFLFVIVSWMAWETHQWMAQTPLASLRKLKPYTSLIFLFIAGVIVTIAALMYLKAGIAWFVLPLAAWAGVLLLRPNLPDSKRFVLFLVGTSLVLTLMVEVIVLRGDIGRMNTVFKFYLQAWTLLAVSTGASLSWLIPALAGWLPEWRRPWKVILTLLVAAAALYPLMAGMAKVQDRMTTDVPVTLDGMAYMDHAKYTDKWGEMDLSQDYRAIHWMQENVKGSPVIVEANLRDLYHWGSRYSIYTGLPGVVGWEWHQQQQRTVTPGEWVSMRIAEIDHFYLTTDPAYARQFLQKYQVRYIIVGQQERGHYAGPGLLKFETENGKLWREVYRDQATVIYEVIPG